MGRGRRLVEALAVELGGSVDWQFTPAGYASRDLRGLMEDGGWKSIHSVVRYAHVVPGRDRRRGRKAARCAKTVGHEEEISEIIEIKEENCVDPPLGKGEVVSSVLSSGTSFR
jgi:hypothetical protein